jgi:NAD(P) transhydrogenase subunit alpha
VRIVGKLNLPGAVPGNASSLYARNLFAFVESMIDKKTGELAVNWDDELVKGTLIARDGAIVNAAIAERAAKSSGTSAAKPKAARNSTKPTSSAPNVQTKRRTKGGEP